MKQSSLMIFISVILIFGCTKKHNKHRVVVVYVSEDQVFSEPILKDFEKETGIKVKAVYDTEETKSTGVMNRLISEKNNPQADVYWANEPIRAEILKQKGITVPYNSPNAKGIPNMFKDPNGYWTGFSGRIRVLIVNKKVKEKPKSIMDYTNPKWKGKGVIANPLFGTTTSHISGLFTVWGEKKGKKFLNDLKQNQIAISSSNGESADLVVSGKYSFSLVDSDDAISRLRQRKKIIMIIPDQKGMGAFVVPNTVMLIKGSPHPKEGKILIDYLLSKKTEEKLAQLDCAQLPLHKGLKSPKELQPIEKIKLFKVNYEQVAKTMIKIQPILKKWAGL